MCSTSNVVSYSSSSSLIACLICVKKSSRLCSNTVSLYPLSLRHLGQSLVRASGPLYPVSTQDAQPKMDEQNLAAMTGGDMGTTWQMLQVKVSLVIFSRPSGMRPANCCSDIMSIMPSSINSVCFIILFICWSLASFLALFLGGLAKLSSSESVSVILVHSESPRSFKPGMMANNFLLGHFQNARPACTE